MKRRKQKLNYEYYTKIKWGEMRKYTITSELTLTFKCNVKMIPSVITCNSNELHKRKKSHYCQDIYSSLNT